MSPAPLYDVISKDLAVQISTGKLKPGERLASESALATHYGVSRMTLRQALSELESSGLLLRRQGAGTFVSEPRVLHRPANRLSSFRDEVGVDGREVSTRMLDRSVVQPPPEVGRQLSLRRNQRALRILRVRSVDGAPMSLQESWLPYLLMPSLAREDLIGGSLYRTLLEREGIELAWADQEITAGLLTETQAEHLNAEVGGPVLLINRTTFMSNGEPVEAALSATLPSLPLVTRLDR